MAEITVGKTVIPYTIRQSLKAKNLTIHVTPAAVEVVVPENTPEEAAHTLVQKRKSWVFTKLLELKEAALRAESELPVHYRSGAKITYRGRRVILHVNRTDREDVGVSYRNGFFIELPRSIPEYDWDTLIHAAIVDWMKDRVLIDAQGFVRKYSRTTGLIAKGIRVAEQKSFWGTCGKDNIIRINWRLAYLPKKVLEYVVAHEVVHLKYRNHSEAFWNLLRSVFNEVDTCQRFLEGQRGL